MNAVVFLDNRFKRLEQVRKDLERAGFEVLRADCVVSALDLARRGHVRAIVVADQIPLLNELDLLVLKNSARELHGVQVVIVSASGRNKFECYKAGCDDFIELPADETEIVFRVCAVLRRGKPSGLSGSFEDVALVDLVQMLIASRQSGRLTVEAKEETGILTFKEGQVVDASCGTERGEDAFLGLLRASRNIGTFNFARSELNGITPSITKRTDHLLLSFASMIDEEAEA